MPGGYFCHEHPHRQAPPEQPFNCPLSLAANAPPLGLREGPYGNVTPRACLEDGDFPARRERQKSPVFSSAYLSRGDSLGRFLGNRKAGSFRTVMGNREGPGGAAAPRTLNTASGGQRRAGNFPPPRSAWPAGAAADETSRSVSVLIRRRSPAFLGAPDTLHAMRLRKQSQCCFLRTCYQTSRDRHLYSEPGCYLGGASTRTTRSRIYVRRLRSGFLLLSPRGCPQSAPEMKLRFLSCG